MGYAPEIEDGIAHSAEGGVDAHSGCLGDFLEGEVLVIAHFEHLLLQFGKLFDEKLHVVADLIGDKDVFNRILAELLAVEDVVVGEVGALMILRFLLTVIVYDKVVGNT